ncbi:MAG TPA: hypothetical protein VL970_10030, partial [Candidatus Acidoferrales bacterium]|nr:hypothetical protein [Candidatus Acidoferrales bacterium]
MNVAGLISAAAASALLLSTTARSEEPGARAETEAAAAAPAPNPAADTPYANIVVRNMFGLVPIPPPDPNAGQPPVDPPPKITPNGIMTIFGRDQALFVVANKPKPGQPAKEDSYVLAEGERQDDIEVVKINHETSIITFNNHGTIQELPLIAAKETGGPEAGPKGGPGVGGRLGGGLEKPGAVGSRFERAFNRNAGLSGGVASRGTGGGTMMGTGNNGMVGGGNSFGGGGSIGFNSASANNSQSGADIEDQVMNAARQMALIEQNRIATQDAVDQGKMPPLPPTMMTPPEATGAGGVPLVNGPPLPPMPE